MPISISPPFAAPCWTVLRDCPPGQWLSTASLVAYLKEHQRYFLIPKQPRFKSKWDEKQGRYGNFYESKEPWGYEIDIAGARGRVRTRRGPVH